ncbi:MAG: flagellar basal body-associated FliL family protein [Proteobacteria bacterium]|nr:flagellar basal body-associated FliL family protein [Pseudomonadota bacterium]
MSAAPPKSADDGSSETPKPNRKKKLILIAAPVVVLLLTVTGLWVSGILPAMLGGKKETHEAHKEKSGPPGYVDLPEMVANLNAVRKPTYIKVVVRIEVPHQEDVEKVKAAVPRLQDLFQTYLREVRPEELRGSAGTYRLREELIARANIAVAPNAVTDVLFTQMLVQ